MKYNLKIYIIILCVFLCSVSCGVKNEGVFPTENNTSETDALTDVIVAVLEKGDDFSVTFYPVGKGDCIIARSGNETMMVDSGYKKNSDEILEYLNENNIERLDIVIATHPDKDHIGAFAGIIESGMPIGVIYKTYAVKNDAKQYDNFMTAISDYGIETENPAFGSSIRFGNAIITFLGPALKNYEDINDSSIVIRLEYAEKSFLLTGDMLIKSESELLNGKFAEYLPSDILKIGHHGRGDASSSRFLSAVNPQYAVITSDYAKDDPPDESVIENIEGVGARILRTDIEGLIKFSVSPTGDIDISTDASYTAVKEKKKDKDTTEETAGEFIF